MAVTDLQVAAVRALLKRDFETARRLFSEIGEDGMRYGYFPLITAAYIEAATTRFRGKKRRDVREWVAEIRKLWDDDSEFDPEAAETLLLWAFNKASTQELEPAVSHKHQAALLIVLVDELGMDDTELDAFLEEARRTVDITLEGYSKGPDTTDSTDSEPL